MTFGLSRRLPAWMDDGIGIPEFIETMEDSANPRLFAQNILGFLDDIRNIPGMEHLGRLPLVASDWRRLAQRCDEILQFHFRTARKPPAEFYADLLDTYARIRTRTWYLYVDASLAPTPMYHQIRS
ncbi:unnamed protein product [Symbiodinium sp. CCMP2592]|nr:unnamed protein product [Symbiodinium sp. CCMP2592]